MKKVEFIKLNLQQENILSKEERKEVLGGYQQCYVRCGNSVTVTGASSCAELQNICGPYERPSCCVCGGSC